MPANHCQRCLCLLLALCLHHSSTRQSVTPSLLCQLVLLPNYAIVTYSAVADKASTQQQGPLLILTPHFSRLLSILQPVIKQLLHPITQFHNSCVARRLATGILSVQRSGAFVRYSLFCVFIIYATDIPFVLLMSILSSSIFLVFQFHIMELMIFAVTYIHISTRPNLPLPDALKL